VVNLLWIFLFIGIGLTIERLVKSLVLNKYFQVDRENIKGMNQSNRFIASIVNALPEFIGLFLFFGVAYVSFVFFEPSGLSFVQLTFFAFLVTISLIRTVSIVSNILLSPSVKEFRFIPLDCKSAKSLRRGTILVFGYIFSVLIFAAVAHTLGAQLQTVLLLQLFFASLLLFCTAACVLLYKNRVKAYITHGENDEAQASWGMSQFASVWHILAILYLGLLWLLLINSIASPQEGSKGAFLLSFFVVPIWLLADQIVQWLVRYALSTLQIHEEEYEDKEEVEEEVFAAREKGRILYLKTKNVARTALIAAISIWVAGLWNIQIPFISDFAAVILDALIILTLALFFWKFVSNWIEAKIQESIGDEEDDESSDDEWGGTARGRSYTLLPMIRKFIASVLIIMVTLTILSAMGVDIGPLLAGAGVVGLAIGFGAQKLVADMFSGFFYLLDDAFRVGEYVTAGSVSGTVESITLRNVMLRHHRGMLQIVPHSDLGAITNFMRGGMVVKFNLDFPYDTDIDKVRKIIKKVGIAMLDDPEIGKDFIRPVKSQGVREITNSVMTIRAKFTAQPGTHFVIRREAYRRITEALKAAGLEYAHRKVIVDVPGLEESVNNGKLSSEDAKAVAETAGAAALSASTTGQVPPAAS